MGTLTESLNDLKVLGIDHIKGTCMKSSILKVYMWFIIFVYVFVRVCIRACMDVHE